MSHDRRYFITAMIHAWKNVIFLSIITAVSSLSCRVIAAAAEPIGLENKLIVMPKMEVTERAVEPERWRTIETGRYQIFSDGNEGLIREFARLLDESKLVTSAVWPGPQPVDNGGKLTLVLCDTTKSFRRFVPTQVASEVSLEFVDRLKFGPPGARILVFECSGHGHEALQRSLLRDYARRVLTSASKPPMPDWFVTGLSEIISFATATRQADGERVTFGQTQASSSPLFPEAPVPLYATLRLSDEVRDFIDGALDEKIVDFGTEDEQPATDLPTKRMSFSQYFGIYRSHRPLADVLAHKPAVSPDEYRMTCWAFVHMCLLGEPQHYRDGLLKLVRASAGKPNEPMATLLKTSFNSSANSLETIVDLYSHTATSVGAVKVIKLTVEDEAKIREASEGEIASFKLRAFTAGNRLDDAHREQVKIDHIAKFAPAQTTRQK